MDMQADPWAAFNPQPVSDPGFTGVIPGAPKPTAPKTTYHTLSPDEAKARGLNPDETYQVSSEGEVKSIGKLPNQNDNKAKTQSAMDSTRDLIQSIERARGLVSNWSTGLGGAVGKLYPGSDQANQLDTVVHQELRGNIFKNWVAQLKAQSDTGTSGIGRIMQSEIPLVTGSLGALDPVKMGRQGTLDSFDQIENRVLRSAALLNNENPDDPKVLQKYREQFVPHTSGATPPGASPPGGGSSGGDGGGGPPGTSQLTPDQQSAEQAFRATNPTPEQYASFLTGVLGKQVTVDSAKARLDAAAKGAPYNPGVQDLTEQQKVKDRIATEDKLGLNESPATTLLKQGSTLNLSDEAAGVGNAAANVLTSPFTGKFDPVGSYTLGRDVERQRISDAQGQLGYGGTAIEFAGGLASASPTNALAAVTNIPELMRQGAKAGAVGGALAGYGSGEGAQQSLSGAGIGAAGGAAIGALAPYAAGKLAARGAPQGMAPDLAAASQAEGVDLLRPMVDPASRGKFGALESAPGSQNVIREGVDRVRGQLSAKTAALGGDGAPLEPLAAGDTTRGVGLRYITQTGAQFNRQYGRLQNAAADIKIPATQALSETDALLQKLSEFPNENAKEITYLQGLKQDLSKPLSIDGLRSLRSKMRQSIAKGDLTFGADEARVLGVADAASQDITNGLTAAGKGSVAQQFKELDAAYRDRMGMIQGTIQKLIGKRGQNLSGEEVFSNLKSMAGPRGDASGLTRMLDQMTPEERTDIQATFADALGKNNKNEFSTATFLAQTDPRKMPKAMRVALFGESGDQSINNLRLLSRKLEEGVGKFNRSNTANSMWRQMASKFVGSLTGIGAAGGLLEGGMSGGGAGAATGLLVGGAVKGAQNVRNFLSARAMVNPRVSQWLAQAADVSTPSQAKQAVKGLSLVISREPALAHELTPIRDFLDQRVTQLLAADPKADAQDQQQR